MTFNRLATVLALGLTIAFVSTPAPAAAQVKPGDTITRNEASKVRELLSPGNLILVKQGMTIKIVPTRRLEWPPPYKSVTEKYSPQVSLTPDGELKNYLAGLPFPLVDANDPQAATKIMWNFAFRPQYTDDFDARNVESISHERGSAEPTEHLSFGHVGSYKYIGRTEVAPMPLDKNVLATGIAFRAGSYPILDPAELRGVGIVRQGYAIPGFEDAVWEYSSASRQLRRLSAISLSDSFGVSKTGNAGPYGGSNAGATTYASTLDPDSMFGFAAKIQDFSYRLLGEQPMLASVEAKNSPARPCANDNGRTICTENWEMRNLYIVEATANLRSRAGGSVIIPQRYST